MDTITTFLPYLIVGLIIWYATGFAYDHVAKAFTPVTPTKPLNAEPDSTQRIVRHPMTEKDYVETTVTARGGKGNAKLLQFTYYEQKGEE